jgi:aspartyl-tRNA(Asn)/glutamyl-tRNA(Gln) amidotransferase subunit C
MTLTKDEILKIGELAHLQLSDDEIEKFREQLSSVLDYVGKLSKLDLRDIEPAAHITGVTNVLRDDVVRTTEPEIRKSLLDAAPAREGDLIKVKPVFQ